MGTRTEHQVDLLVETAGQITRDSLQVTVPGWEVLEMFSDGVVVADATGAVAYANPVAETLFRRVCGIHDIEQANLSEICFDPAVEKAALVGKTCVSKEVRVKDLVLFVKALPLFKSGEISGCVMVIRDVTEIRAKEKELLVKSAVIQEIHHRVKNDLQTIASLLRLQQRRVDSVAVKNAYADSINRILTIAIVYEVLSKQGLELIDVKEVAEKIVEMQRTATPEPDTRIAAGVTGDKIVLTGKQAMSVGLIVNELVHNAISHAFHGRSEGEIEVSLEDKGAFVVVRVRDNGTGFPKGFSLRKAPTLGLSIVQALVEDDLRGVIEISSRNGAHIEVRFPKRGDQEGVLHHGATEGGRRR